jgi:hypothetical protein
MTDPPLGPVHPRQLDRLPQQRKITHALTLPASGASIAVAQELVDD